MGKISSTSFSHKKALSKRLMSLVKKAVKHAHAPYSRIRVGAALYCASGKIYTGANIENSSYSLTMCAERVAIFKAVSEGEKDFTLLLVYSPHVDPIVPCGACLQVISEIAPDITLVTMNDKDEFKFLPIKTLLPQPFILGTKKKVYRG
jgi:cytidine deaminase